MRKIVVDTNLLLLWVVGETDDALIGRHKRTNLFTREDFTLLQIFLEGFERVVVTPGILTELSNLVRQIGEPHRSMLMATVQLLVDQVNENHVPATEVVGSPFFVRLGLTDVTILKAVEESDHLLTVDLDLWIEATKAGRSATNFNHLRQEYLLRP
jgi:hypothetical protein